MNVGGRGLRAIRRCCPAGHHLQAKVTLKDTEIVIGDEGACQDSRSINWGKGISLWSPPACNTTAPGAQTRSLRTCICISASTLCLCNALRNSNSDLRDSAMHQPLPHPNMNACHPCRPSGHKGHTPSKAVLHRNRHLPQHCGRQRGMQAVPATCCPPCMPG